jgi:basic membrane lipoprotein Med (substrate-binding protein (PBP1-ABC) superfamily)
MKPILKAMVEDIYAGKYGQGKYTIELGKGMELAPFYNFDPIVPKKAKEMIREVREKILKGEIVVPKTWKEVGL